MNYYTHAGLFHADELMGYAICHMAKITDTLVRLKDLTNIPTDGIIADIGREYDPTQRKFDHHQGVIRRDDGFMYASVGLLWKEYGKTALICMDVPMKHIDLIHKRVDERLIKGIDAHDADNSYQLIARTDQNELNVFSLPNVISMYNHTDLNHEVQQINAHRAIQLCITVLTRVIMEAVNYANASDGFNQIAKFKLEGAVIILSKALPWKEIVCERYPDARYVIIPSNHPGNPCSMVAVPVEPTSRTVKCPIERPDWFFEFIHQGKWIAGSDDIDTLLELADYNIRKHR